MKVVGLMLMRLHGDCKHIPDMELGFGIWFDLMKMVMDHVHMFASCKGAYALCFETLRVLMFRFVQWPVFSRERRIRTLMPKLRVGDLVEISMLHMEDVEARLVHHTLMRRSFTFDVEGVRYRANVRQISFLRMM